MKVMDFVHIRRRKTNLTTLSLNKVRTCVVRLQMDKFGHIVTASKYKHASVEYFVGTVAVGT